MRDPVVLIREFDAPPERVFEAWTTVDLLTQWFGCATDMLWTVHEWDVRPGGALHVSLDFDDNPYVVKGEFVEIDEPHRLVYAWENDQRVTVTIEPVGSGSRLTLEHAGLPNDEMCKIVTGGWTAGLTQIKAVLP